MKTIDRRICKLEAELTPSSDEPVLTIVVKSPGEPDEIIELRGVEPNGRRRPRPWNTGYRTL
jgi:hypothetical protein